VAGNTCPCDSDYVNVGSEVICERNCHYTCDTCSIAHTGTACLTCPDSMTSHRIPGSNNDCPCETGFLSVPNQINC